MLKISLEDRKSYIADKATHIFIEKGFQSTSLQDIASAIGITKAGIYHYFASKEDILFHILMAEHERNLKQFQMLRHEFEDPSLSPIEALKTLLRVYARITLNNLKIPLLGLRERHQLTGKNRKAHEKKEKEIFNILRDALAGIPCLNKSHNINGIVFMVISMHVWVGYWNNDRAKLSLDQIIEQNIQMICHGISG